MIAKCLLRPRRELSEGGAAGRGDEGSACWWGSAWSSPGMPGLAASLLRAVGVFPSLSMGFGSSPWHAACLFWRPSEDKSILSMAALFSSPLVQLLLASCGPTLSDIHLLSERPAARALWKACFSLTRSNI